MVLDTQRNDTQFYSESGIVVNKKAIILFEDDGFFLAIG